MVRCCGRLPVLLISTMSYVYSRKKYTCSCPSGEAADTCCPYRPCWSRLLDMPPPHLITGVLLDRRRGLWKLKLSPLGYLCR